MREASHPQQAVAYSHSRYYTVSAQQQQTVYRPMLTQIGAEQATPMAWTSETETSSMRIRPRMGMDDLPDLTDAGRDKDSPVGEAWALLALAVLYAGYTSLHRKKSNNTDTSRLTI